MKSQIHITETEGNKNIPAAPDNSVLLTSNNIWAGIKVEHHNLAAIEMPEHIVQEHRLIINIGGSVNFEWKAEGKWHKKLFRNGEFMLLSHGEINKPRWRDEMNFIAVALSPEYIDGLVEINNFSFTEQRMLTDGILSNLSAKFIEELKQEHLAGKVYGESLTAAFAIHLAGNYAANQKRFNAPKGKLSSQQLSKIIDYSNSFIHNNIGLSDLAKQANLSPFHLTRLFKQTVGIPPHQYILQIKLERARQLLKLTKLTMTEVAYELGFTDQAHFSNAFRKAVGCSPRQYLKI